MARSLKRTERKKGPAAASLGASEPIRQCWVRRHQCMPAHMKTVKAAWVLGVPVTTPGEDQQEPHREVLAS